MAEGSDGAFFCKPDFSHQGKDKWTLYVAAYIWLQITNVDLFKSTFQKL